jgi:hypothetical protein
LSQAIRRVRTMANDFARRMELQRVGGGKAV